MQNTVVIKRPEWLSDDEVKRIAAIHEKAGDVETLTFEECTKEQVEAVIFGLPAKNKQKDITSGKTKAVDGEDLELLKMTTDLDLDKGKVFKFEAANSVIDRTNERFSVSVLEKFADDINTEGRTFLFSHQRDQVIGQVFHAQVEQADGKTALIEFVFIPTGIKLPNQPGIEFSAALEMGLIKFVSVGFSAFRRRVEEGGKEFIEYYMDADNPEHKEFTEQTELSAVYLGAQRGAAQKEYIVKSLEYINKSDMATELEKQVADLTEEIKTLKEQATEKDSTIGTLTAERDGIKAENEKLNGIVDEYLSKYRNDVLNLQAKFLSEDARLTEDQVKSLTSKQLIAMANDLNEKFADQADPKEDDQKDSKKVGF